MRDGFFHHFRRRIPGLVARGRTRRSAMIRWNRVRREASNFRTRIVSSAPAEEGLVRASNADAFPVGEARGGFEPLAGSVRPKRVATVEDESPASVPRGTSVRSPQGDRIRNRPPRAKARGFGPDERKARPRTESDHPPNLSISISGGKETNGDALGSGERRGHRSSRKSVPRPGVRIVARELVVDDTRRGGCVGPSDLERSAAEGESPASRAKASPSSSTETMSSSALSRVGLFEIAAPTRVVDPIQSRTWRRDR